MKCYREHIASLPPGVPVIPFLPLALKDLIFINDGNDKIIANTGCYNFDRMRMISRVCFDLQGYECPAGSLSSAITYVCPIVSTSRQCTHALVNAHLLSHERAHTCTHLVGPFFRYQEKACRF